MKSAKLIFFLFVVEVTLSFCYTYCQKKVQTSESSPSKKDTIAIIETALADSTLNSLFLESFPGKNLKIVRNEFVLPHYEIAFKGKHVPIVSYDSTLHNRTSYPISARFFEEVFYFKTQPDQQIIDP